jgi:hypothetical protein
MLQGVEDKPRHDFPQHDFSVDLISTSVLPNMGD